MNQKPFTVQMDPLTKAQITRLLEAMTVDFEPVLSVRPDWFPRKEGEAMFRVVQRNEDRERTVHSLGAPADFRFEAPKDEAQRVRLGAFLSRCAQFVTRLLEVAAKSSLDCSPRTIQQARVMPVCGDDPAWIISIGEYAVWVSNLRGIGLTVTMVQYPGWLDALYAFSEVPVDALPEEPHIVPLRSPGQADVESEGEEVQ